MNHKTFGTFTIPTLLRHQNPSIALCDDTPTDSDCSGEFRTQFIGNTCVQAYQMRLQSRLGIASSLALWMW